MAENSSSGESDWAVVTQEGDLADESEDDASCSGSSIELLTSDDEGDSLPGSRGSPDTGKEQSGPFFVLRLRSKEILTDTDSDDKEDVTKMVSVKKSSIPQVERSEPELLLPSGSDSSSKEETIVRNNKAEHVDPKSQVDTNSFMDGEPPNTSENKKDMESSVTQLPCEMHQVKNHDNISFPSSSGNSSSSEESLPEILQSEAPEVSPTESQSISPYSDEATDVIDEVHIQDIRSTSSLTSSNFSLLDQTDSEKIEEQDLDIDGSLNTENEENPTILGGYLVVDNQDVKPGVHSMDQPKDEADNSSKQINETRASTPVVIPDIDNLTARVVLEVVCVFIVAISCYCVGYTQGDNSMLCCHDLRNAQQETEAVFLKMAGLIEESVHGLKEDGLSMQNIDWNDMNRNFDDKDPNVHIKRFQALDVLLTKYTASVTNLVSSLTTEKNGVHEDISELKTQQDKLKNENADLHKEIIELGKRKYLVRELEDENFALFKRIGDLENQLMDAQDQSYVHQIQISNLEKKVKSKDSNEKSYMNDLHDKIDKLEEEKLKLGEDIVTSESRIKDLEVENRKMDQYALDVDKCREEMMEIMMERSKLSIQVEQLKSDLNLATDRTSELEKKIEELKDPKETIYKEYQNEEEIQDSEETEESEDEGISIQSNDDSSHDENDKNDNYQSDRKQQNGGTTYPEPDRWTSGKASREKLNKESDKEQSGTNGGHSFWSDAMNDILNKTKSSMASVNQQIQDTLSQVKNLSEELWKKHEPSVNHILMNTYEKVKSNIHDVTKKVTKAAAKIVEKSAKWIRKHRKLRKKRRHGKKFDDWDDETARASTSRRKYKNQDSNSEKFSHRQDQKASDKHFDNFASETTDFPGYLESELQSLRDSVEYINTLQDLKCSELIDIMEDFQNFKKIGGVIVLSSQEKFWFYCQKTWFESMAYSNLHIENECKVKIGPRQIAAVDYGCCPCFGQYGRSKGKFCHLENGCSQVIPKELNTRRKKNQEQKIKNGNFDSIDLNEKKNDTMEEETAKNHGKYIYCDPFSQDLDCGDESWYLKRMKDREHLRKYRTSSKSDWLFKRAEERDYQRTQPDDWFFNRMGGQTYEAHQDDSWHEHDDL